MAETKKSGNEEFIAIIRIRGEVNIKGDIKDTLRMLNIGNKNNMAIVEKNPANLGMIRKVSGYVTYGIVSKEIAEKYGIKKTIKMHPPRGGFERKGIKVPFKVGGALGDRGNKISELIDKMKVE
jgi:large subunit ribosomal protein L30